jgi:predicted nucleotidyltransferase
MTATSLDFSRRTELTLHGRVVAHVTGAATPLGIDVLIVGAFARDLHLVHAHGVPAQRQTEDVDLALAVPDWKAFKQLQQQLVASGDFTVSHMRDHRLRHRDGLPIDLVPFGKVESEDRTIAWPPRGDIVLDVFGFQEARATAIDVVLPGPALAHLVTLPALALLKIVCWQDRHSKSPRKDAQDLMLILSSYLDAGNTDRLWGEFIDWTKEDDFDTKIASARMLGHDIQALVDRDGLERIAAVLSVQTRPGVPGLLAAEMNRHDPERAVTLLDALLTGLLEG